MHKGLCILLEYLLQSIYYRVFTTEYLLQSIDSKSTASLDREYVWEWTPETCAV